MAEFFVADDTPQGVREVTCRSTRVFQRSPYHSADYRLEIDQVNREVALIGKTLDELDAALSEISQIVVDGDSESVVTVSHYGTIIDNNEPTLYTIDNNLSTIFADSDTIESSTSLVGTGVLSSDLQNLARRVVALEQGR